MTLSLYITRRFLRSMVMVTLVIGGIAALISGVENLRYAASKDASVALAGALTLFQMPEVMGQTFPLILMLASLITFLNLSRTSEMVIVRASGVSALRILVLPVAVAALLGGVATTIYNPIMAASMERESALRAAMSGTQVSAMSVNEGGLWLRQGLPSGQTVIQARRASEEGSVLYGARLHQFDPDDRLVARIEADSATLSKDAWILLGVRRWTVGGGAEGAPIGAPEELSQLRLPTNLTREQILDSFAAPETIPFWKLPAFIERLEQAGFSATRHRVFLHTELARPALFIAMVLIGAGFSLRHVRFGQVGVMILFAVFAGFSLYFFIDIARTLGSNGEIPVVLAAWSPPAAAILLALGLLLHLEDG
ncbi:LPS export ABC transporter permease LptG [Halovulum marinum]|nr:LPS export ABC transporter permease LptG [Halovulum marinum]